jgi:polar amino acid transport system substrate-binding protein
MLLRSNSRSRRGRRGGRPSVLLATGVAGLTWLLAACSPGTSSPGTTATPGAANSSNAIPKQAYVKALHDELPAEIRNSGVIVDGTDPTVPPYDSYAPDSHTLIGIDPDLLTAMGQILGVRISFQEAQFSELIPGLTGGRFQVAWADAGDRASREKQVDLLDYSRTLSTFLVRANGGPNIATLLDACGKSAALEEGDAEANYLGALSKRCTAAGKPVISISLYPDLNEAILAVRSGRDQMVVADPLTLDLAVQASNGFFKTEGPSLFSVDTAAMFPKGSSLEAPMLAALKILVKNGTYTSIFRKWKAMDTTISAPGIDLATKSS